ncbi:MAG: discoidin domain-containing protein [Lentisphaeria bacterium]|nr:discoidin domain-containing protein [Candidatus Neomarinimicrobiota bacterium]MCF7842566.1 discoidin domain-containing protein [Lentisphaeria bacterium]
MDNCRTWRGHFYWLKQRYQFMVTFLFLGLGIGLAQPQYHTLTSVSDFATGATMQGCVVDSAVGAIILEGDSTQNIALDKPAKFVRPDETLDASQITDGSAADLNHHAYYTSKNWTETYAEVDLESERNLYKVIIRYRADVASVFAPTDYLLSISLEGTTWDTVAAGQMVAYINGALTIRFPAQLGRFVRFHGLKQPNAQPKTLGLGELEVYSLGPVPVGNYISGIQDLGGRMNLGRFTWQLTLPTSTGASVRFRSDSTLVTEMLMTDGVWNPGEDFSDFGANGINNDTNGDGTKQSNEAWDTGEQDGEYTVGEPFVDNGYTLTHPWFPLGGLTVEDTAGTDLLAAGTVHFDTTNNIVLWSDTTGIDEITLPPIVVTYTAWSGWSAPTAVDNQFLPVPEPRQYFQFAMSMFTGTTSTPELNEISFEYDSRLIATKVDASLDVAEAPVLKDTTITYSLDFTFGATDYGVDTILVYTPAAIHDLTLSLDGADINDLATTRAESDRFYVIFNNTFNTTGKLGLTFNVVFSEPNNTLPAIIMSTGSPDNPQRVDESPTGWQVTVPNIPEVSLNLVTIKPNPITPNNDGVCDVAHISFYVAKLSEQRPVTITIYDIRGRKVATVLDGTYPATYFGGASGPTWDATNQSGERVAPGVYLCQIRVESDAGDNVFTKPIVVAY